MPKPMSDAEYELELLRQKLSGERPSFHDWVVSGGFQEHVYGGGGPDYPVRFTLSEPEAEQLVWHNQFTSWEPPLKIEKVKEWPAKWPAEEPEPAPEPVDLGPVWAAFKERWS